MSRFSVRSRSASSFRPPSKRLANRRVSVTAPKKIRVAAPFTCRCGSKTHQRVTSADCSLNPDAMRDKQKQQQMQVSKRNRGRQEKQPNVSGLGNTFHDAPGDHTIIVTTTPHSGASHESAPLFDRCSHTTTATAANSNEYSHHRDRHQHVDHHAAYDTGHNASGANVSDAMNSIPPLRLLSGPYVPTLAVQRLAEMAASQAMGIDQWRAEHSKQLMEDLDAVIEGSQSDGADNDGDEDEVGKLDGSDGGEESKDQQSSSLHHHSRSTLSLESATNGGGYTANGNASAASKITPPLNSLPSPLTANNATDVPLSFHGVAAAIEAQSAAAGIMSAGLDLLDADGVTAILADANANANEVTAREEEDIMAGFEMITVLSPAGHEAFEAAASSSVGVGIAVKAPAAVGATSADSDGTRTAERWGPKSVETKIGNEIADAGESCHVSAVSKDMSITNTHVAERTEEVEENVQQQHQDEESQKYTDARADVGIDRSAVKNRALIGPGERAELIACSIATTSVPGTGVARISKPETASSADGHSNRMVKKEAVLESTRSSSKRVIKSPARFADETPGTQLKRKKPDIELSSMDGVLSPTNAEKRTGKRIPLAVPRSALPARVENTDEHNDVCTVCRVGGDLLCCDGCSFVWHVGCLNPPLKKIPEGDWWCQYCVAAEGAGANATHTASHIAIADGDVASARNRGRTGEHMDGSSASKEENGDEDEAQFQDFEQVEDAEVIHPRATLDGPGEYKLETRDCGTYRTYTNGRRRKVCSMYPRCLYLSQKKGLCDKHWHAKRASQVSKSVASAASINRGLAEEDAKKCSRDPPKSRIRVDVGETSTANEDSKRLDMLQDHLLSFGGSADGSPGAGVAPRNMAAALTTMDPGTRAMVVACMSDLAKCVTSERKKAREAKEGFAKKFRQLSQSAHVAIENQGSVAAPTFVTEVTLQPRRNESVPQQERPGTIEQSMPATGSARKEGSFVTEEPFSKPAAAVLVPATPLSLVTTRAPTAPAAFTAAAAAAAIVSVPRGEDIGKRGEEMANSYDSADNNQCDQLGDDRRISRRAGALHEVGKVARLTNRKVIDDRIEYQAVWQPGVGDSTGRHPCTHPPQVSSWFSVYALRRHQPPEGQSIDGMMQELDAKLGTVLGESQTSVEKPAPTSAKKRKKVELEQQLDDERSAWKKEQHRMRLELVEAKAALADATVRLQAAQKQA